MSKKSKKQYTSRLGLSWAITAKEHYRLVLDNVGYKRKRVTQSDDLLFTTNLPQLVKSSVKREFVRLGLPTIILTRIIAVIDSNMTTDFSYWASNKNFIDHFKEECGIELKQSDVIKLLQRLAKTGIITLVYNPNLKTKITSRYDGYDDGEVVEQPGIIVDYSSSNYRLIKLNVELLNKIVGAVDELDPFIKSLPARSFLRKYFRRRPFVNMELVSKEFKQIKARAKKTDKFLKQRLHAQLACSSAAYILFLKNVASKFYNLSGNQLLQYRLYANKYPKGALEDPPVYDDDTGELITDDIFKKYSNMILDDIFGKLKTKNTYYTSYPSNIGWETL